ncbi:MAG: hypothetical protein HY821_06200 [Acidobacteria bacterium]|nr:hypothetical protein [Acidobacteriota bacterium]
MFTDQKWIDLMPCFFPGVRIERSTRFNVAYWNLASRIVEFENGKWTVDGQPLGFFHFSGLNPESPKAFSKHQNRFTLDGIGEAKELVLMYAQSVLEQGHRDSKKWKYTYNYFAGGQEIPLRTLPSTEDLFEGIADPFSDIGRDRFFSYWNGPATGFAGETADGVTRHAFLIYNMRPDVRAAMPMIFSLDRTQFLNWMITSGQREHRLKEGTLGPIRAALERCCQEQADGPGRAPEKDPKGGRQSEPRPPSGGQFVPHALKKLASHVPPAVLALLLNNSVELEDAIEALDAEGTLHQWLLETPVSEPLLPRLSCLIYDSRPDLQYKFPRFRAGDIRTFGLWLAIHGKAEYALPDSLVTDMMRKMTVPLALRGGIGSFVLRAILLLNPPPKQSAKTA